MTTTAGDLDLRIPKLRTGSFFPFRATAVGAAVLAATGTAVLLPIVAIDAVLDAVIG